MKLYFCTKLSCFPAIKRTFALRHIRTTSRFLYRHFEMTFKNCTVRVWVDQDDSNDVVRRKETDTTGRTGQEIISSSLTALATTQQFALSLRSLAELPLPEVDCWFFHFFHIIQLLIIVFFKFASPFPLSLTRSRASHSFIAGDSVRSERAWVPQPLDRVIAVLWLLISLIQVFLGFSAASLSFT